MKTLNVNTQEEFNMMVDCSDFRIIEAIVEGALQNLKTTKRFVHILSVAIEEDNDVYDLTLERCEFLDNLKKNLKHYEKQELYEKCGEIIKAIKFLEKKQKKGGKKINISYS